MRCDASNGYLGWVVKDADSGDKIPDVVWVDPDANTYCAAYVGVTVNGKPIYAEHHVAAIVVDVLACTFWAKKLPATVILLRQAEEDPQPSDQPCPDCCQPEACRRTSYCAAHRGPFGEAAP